jgi:hypothetical protein
MSLRSALENAKTVAAALTAKNDAWIKGIDRIALNKQAMVVKALQSLRPVIITELQRSYRASGLHSRSGRLEAAVSNPAIVISSKGIRITIDGDEQVCKQAAALQYGRVTGGGGTRLKKTLKKTGAASSGNTVIAAHPFFNLSSGSLDRLQKLFNAAMQAQINAVAIGGLK